MVGHKDTLHITSSGQDSRPTIRAMDPRHFIISLYMLMLTLQSGNRPQMWHPTKGVKFMQDITKEYGGVVRLNGVFGV